MLHNFLGNCANALAGMEMSTGLPFALASAGFVGSWVHCTSMCGVNAVNACASNCQKKDISGRLAMPQFHMGRMVSYSLLTVLTFSLFHIGFAWSPYRQLLSVIMLFLAGVIFLASSMPFFQKLWPWAQSIQFPMPQSFRRFFLVMAHRAQHPFARGFLVGFMPCGLLFSALLAAASAPSMGVALIAIMAFIAGTIPALVAVHFAGLSFKHFFPKSWGRVQRGLLALNGIFFITCGIYLAVTGF